MVTVVDLTDQEIAELQEFTNQEDVAIAIRTALAEYLRSARRMRLKELSGRVRVQGNWMELENGEAEPSNDDSTSRTD